MRASEFNLHASELDMRTSAAYKLAGARLLALAPPTAVCCGHPASGAASRAARLDNNEMIEPASERAGALVAPLWPPLVGRANLASPLARLQQASNKRAWRPHLLLLLLLHRPACKLRSPDVIEPKLQLTIAPVRSRAATQNGHEINQARAQLVPSLASSEAANSKSTLHALLGARRVEGQARASLIGANVATLAGAACLTASQPAEHERQPR